MSNGPKKSPRNTLLWMVGLLGDLKPSLAHPIYRAIVTIPPHPEGVEFKVASNKAELEGAYRLLHNAYVAVNLMNPEPSGMRLNAYNALPTTTTIVAKKDDKIIGTVTIVRDNPLGLPLDETVDTTSIRKPGWRVAEVTGLAVDKDWRSRGQIFFPLLKYLYHYATYFMQVDVLQIATTLERADFFRAVLFFEPLVDSVVADPLINNFPVETLYIDLSNARIQMKRFYGGRATAAANLHQYFTGSELPGFIFPKRDNYAASDPVMSAELFTYFFKEKTDLIYKLTDRETHVLKSIYHGTPIAEMLPTPQTTPPFPRRRESMRYTVNCPAVLEQEMGDESVTLLDVSESGFRLFCRMPMRLSETCFFRVFISPQKSVPLAAQPVWNRQKREWGFTIIEAPSEWGSYLRYLNDQLANPSKRAG